MSITIHCPKCNAGLKLPDRSLLGRKGKCPKCAHRFVLQDPDEVELELAEPDPPAVPEEPLMGTGAQWIPDEVPAADPVFPPADGPEAFAAPVSPAAGASGVPDFTQLAGQAPATAPTGAPASAATPIPQAADVQATSAAVPSPAAPIAPAVAPPPEESSITARTRRRRRNKTGPVIIGVGTALFAFCIIGLLWQQSRQAEERAAAQTAKSQPRKNEAWDAQKADLQTSNEDAKQLSPTHGEPIPVSYMPFTPHLLFHLRPAELWARDRQQQEFTTLFFDLNTWLKEKIRDITRFEPEEIQELTIAVNFGARTAEPDVAAVVRLVSEQSAADMQLIRFKGSVRPDLDEKIYESESWSYMLLDSKTFAVAPVTMSDMLADAKKFSRQPSVELEALLKETDRRRQLTLLFDLTNIDTHREYIFNEDMQKLVDEFVLWFGKDVQAVCWSAHLTQDRFFMETLLHNAAESSPLKVQRLMKGRLEKLPEQMLSVVRMMQPETVGYRKMIGRLPAMLQAFVLGTSTHVGTQYVRLVTLLPAKAAPNLAAASILTWHQSLKTDFDGPEPVVAQGPKIPDKVVDRLKQMKVFVDFSGTPLQEALQYIADELQVQLQIDGDGLKQVALTQNMRQNHKVGEVTAIEALDLIVNNPDYRDMMVLVVDEDAKKILVTSRPAAEEAGLPIFDLKQR